MSSQKKVVRKTILQYRKLLDREIFDQRNESVLTNISQLVVEKKVNCVHSFLPIEKNREVNTWPIIGAMRKLNVRAVLSATDFQRQTMSHFWDDDSLEFENDQFGIPTPINGKQANLAQVDMVLIPLLAADRTGNRIGYGKGYYDRLLSGMNPKVWKVGLTLGPVFDHFSFAEPHDINLNFCVTPHQIIDCDSTSV